MSPKAQVAANLRAPRRRVDTADHFRLLADYAPVMIWIADAEGRSVYFNPQWLRFRGRKLEEEIGAAWIEGVHPDDRDRYLDAHAAAVQAGEPFEMELRLRRADGEHRRVRMNGAPIIDATRPAGFVGSCVDVTDHVAAQARHQFLAMVSHELRAPLNGIKSWTHVLENQLHESSDPTLRRAIDGIMIGVEQQVRLIEDLLDMTRALGGDLELAKQPMALAPALADAIEGLRALADEKGVHLIVGAALAGAEILGDFVRVHQILTNLLANAIKFTPAGGHVWVTAVMSGGTARIEVRDDGAGIPPELLPHVFDPFRRAGQSAASSRRQQDLGLGLALAQRLAELHGGQVSCESVGAGCGTTIRLQLPLRCESAARKLHPEADYRGG